MKVLHVIYGLNVGGAETFIYNVLSELNSNEYRVDFLIQDANITNEKLYDLCKRKGCTINVISKFNRNLFKHKRQTKKVLMLGYDVVHIHMNALINIYPILIAKKMGIKTVVHSHNTNNNRGGLVAKLLHYFNRMRIKKICTWNVACGKEAGEWLFGKLDFQIIDNAIKIETYLYNKERRKKIREKLNISEEFVIGHVGRFVEAKNHRMLIDIFFEFNKVFPKSKLVMLGDGPMKDEMNNYVCTLGIAGDVYFEGNQKNVEDYYSAFDCLVFPSYFEGLPFTLIEAQTAGLPLIVSEAVTRDIKLIENVEFLKLDAPLKEWINEIEKSKNNIDRIQQGEKIRKTKYNIEVMIKKIKDIYEKTDIGF